jgi:hypothetical protein
MGCGMLKLTLKACLKFTFVFRSVSHALSFEFTLRFLSMLVTVDNDTVGTSMQRLNHRRVTRDDITVKKDFVKFSKPFTVVVRGLEKRF